jgi:hypothetical protein
LIKACIFEAVQPVMLRRLLFFVIVIMAAMVLSYLVDDNLGWGWPTNVIRNWQDFGFFNLHGKLVANAGGFQATTHPDVYKGMSPISLYPVFFATKLFGWTGLGISSFHLILLLGIFWGSWKLLGQKNWGLLVAALAILCPGCLRWSKIIDPNAISVLPVIPYAVIVLAILKKIKFTPGLAAGLIVLTFAFMSLNWTTAWVCGPLIFLLLGMPGLNRRGLITLIGVMVIGVPLVAAASFAAKVSGGAAGSGAFQPLRVIAGYTWGSGGYGEGTGTGRAFLRLAFVNGIGLFPLWLIFIFAIARRFRSGAKFSWIMFAPLALTVADIVIMRNYFAHHPWMAGPVLVVGVIFSLVLLRISASGQPPNASESVSFQIIVGVALLCFVYGFAVMTFFRVNEIRLLTLVRLVREHTARSDSLIVLKTDSGTVPLVDRLVEPLDRRVVLVDNVKEIAEESHWVILSPVELNGPWALAAQSDASSRSWLTDVADWFNHSISKRAPGDRLELSQTYYLYTRHR